MKKRRADEALLEDLNLESIGFARALIMEGRALAGEKRISNASEMIREGVPLRVKGALDQYVSRGAWKLKKALEVFQIDLKGVRCMDIGCSTGGFTDVMLRSGAERVACVDVGYNLLDYRLRSDPRVQVLERTNARFLTADTIEFPVEFGATDVSFISLKGVLPHVLPVLTGRREFVALIKPQFEAPKEDVGDKGVVRDREVHLRVLKDILAFIPSTGFVVNGLDFSPVRGPEGNIEFLAHLLPADSGAEKLPCGVEERVVDESYDFFVKNG